MLKFSKSTGELFTELKEEKNLKDWRQGNAQEFVLPFHEYLEKILAEKNISKQEAIKRSGLNREYAYHIFSGKKNNPSRQKILALAIALDLTLDETQYFLRYAGVGVLYPRNQWDAVIISAIEQKLSVKQTNELLDSLGETLLLN